MKTVILPKTGHRIFEDAANSFCTVESNDTLCFGVQDWTVEEIKEQKKIAQGKLIAYQSELLCGGNLPFKNEEYAKKLKMFDEIWEYSLHNMDFFRQHAVINVVYKPLLPSSILKDTPMEKKIDILHYGFWKRHRTDCLNRVIAEGFNVYDVLREHGNWIHGNELHQLILSSKLVLGIHSYSQSSIQESFRYQYPLSNGIDVLAEKSFSNPLQLEEFSDADELVHILQKKGFPQNKSRTFFLQNCFFPSYDSYKDEAMSEVESNHSRTVFKYALQRMEEDSLLAFDMRKSTDRTKDADIIVTRIFNALMWIISSLHQSSGIEKKEKKSMQTMMRGIYGRLYRPCLRKKIKSSGGNFMPRLRSTLMLNGWTLFSQSIEMAIRLGQSKKYILYI